ncbi:ArfGAP with SH3 domain, ankyrin repeat and PH domain 1, partial [Chelydra serpentina]
LPPRLAVFSAVPLPGAGRSAPAGQTLSPTRSTLHMPFRMPELISVQDFISQTLEDLSSPTTSSFTSHMGKCRGTVCSLEEALDSDRAVLQKMRKATKAEHASGQGQSRAGDPEWARRREACLLG